MPVYSSVVTNSVIKESYFVRFLCVVETSSRLMERADGKRIQSW